MSEARLDRIDRIEEDVRDIKATLRDLAPLIVRIDERLSSTLPHLATKAELAEKPSRGYLWGVMAAMVGAQAVTLTAAALIFAFVQAHPIPTPPAPHAAAASPVSSSEPAPGPLVGQHP